MRKFISIIFCISILCLGCSKKNIINSVESGQEVDLKINLGLNDFSMGIPEIAKSGAGTDILNNQIISCAICLFKIDQTDLSNSRIVGYRIFVNDASDGHKYFYKNIDNYKDDDGNNLADIQLSDAGSFYNSGDDTTNDDRGNNGISDDGLSVCAEFKYHHPLHGNVEKLRDGEYLVIALANFNEEPIIAIHKTLGYWIKEQIKYWQDHQNEANFNGIVYNPIMSGSNIVFAGSKQILDARVRLYDATIESLASGGNPSDPIYIASHRDVIKSESYVHHSSTALCASTSQNIKLKAGNNLFTLKLIRLATRASFSINNYSTKPIIIEQFRLSSNFGSAATYLFPVAGTYSEHNSTSWLGEPITNSPHAIIPFDNTIEYAPGSSNEVFFDALLASGYDESRNNPLSYSITIAVKDDIVSVIPKAQKRAYNDLLNDLAGGTWSIGEGREFVMQTMKNTQPFIKNTWNSTKNKYVPKVSSVTDVTTLFNDYIESATPDDYYIWVFEKVNLNSILIKNKGTNQYMKASGKNANGGLDYLNWVDDKTQAQVFEINRYTNYVTPPEGALAFKSVYDGVNIFLADYNFERIITCSQWSDAGAHFFVYPVNDISIYGTSKAISVPVEVYNQATGKVSPLHEIKRNEHLKVNINVNYNENSQDITFSVNDWNSKEKEIRFD